MTYHLAKSARLLAAGVFTFSAVSVTHAATDEEIAWFENNVRPVLANNCFKCHGPDEQEGELRLDHISTILDGGEYGPAIVAGAPEKSNVIEAINWLDPDFQMPPKKKLSDVEIAALTKWVEMGAPWPDEPLPGTNNEQEEFDLEGRKNAHWAWQPIANPAVPEIDNVAWSRNSIDAFIYSKLADAGLKPADRAGKRTLIRRLYFDLIGLPPSPEAVEKFVADSSPNAYENLVDSLLANPAFGERWGRHWLDLTRFAETYGHEGDYPIREAWKYRDYVIRAFNQDLPYDDLIREHIAGDLIEEPRINPEGGYNESIIGTGWWFMHQATHAPVDVAKDEADRIDNQIDVLGKTFLAMTVACARCHDHKFDAISTKDYYAMTGYVRASRQQFAFLDMNGSIAKKAVELASLHQDATPTVTKNVARLAKSSDDIEGYLLAVRDLIDEDFNIDDKEKVKAAKEKVPAVASARGLEESRLKSWSNALINSGVKNSSHPFNPWFQLVNDRKLRASEADDEYEVYETFEDGSFDDWFVSGEAFGDGPTTALEWSVDNSTPLIPAGVAHSGRISPKLLGALRSPTFRLEHDTIQYRASGKRGKLRLVIDSYQIRDFNGLLFQDTLTNVNSDGNYEWITQISGLSKFKGKKVYIELIDDSDDGWIAVDEIRFANKRNNQRDAANALLSYEEEIDTYEQLAAAYVAWAKDGFESWSNHEGDPVNAGYLNFLLNRNLLDESRFDKRVGDIRQALLDAASDLPYPNVVLAMAEGTPEEPHIFIRGNHTSPGADAPTAFLSALGGDQPQAESRGRLHLAEEIVDPSNPLTSRVMVNRIWHHLFGRGIVESVDDFGVLGRNPTQPELLDHLAAKFRDEGWSIKEAIRHVVTSEAYAMSSALSNENAETEDPANFLVHRQNVRRLQGEAIRDSLLAVSGQLDRTMYGNSIPAHLYPFMTNHRRPGESGPVDAERRRSIYMRVQRNFLSPMMLAYDMPLPDTAIGKRTVSNVPAQSLIMMNDPFVAQQAEAWANKLIADAPDSVANRIDAAYVQAFGREASELEQTKIQEFVNLQGAEYGLSDAEILTNIELWRDICQVLFMSKEFIYIG